MILYLMGMSRSEASTLESSETWRKLCIMSASLG
jgi:hypothetical protein